MKVIFYFISHFILFSKSSHFILRLESCADQVIPGPNPKFYLKSIRSETKENLYFSEIMGNSLQLYQIAILSVMLKNEYIFARSY